MKTFREITRAFFSIFLVLAGFIGCCESFNWMAELSTSPYQVKHAKENYGERYYEYDYPEEKQEELSPDTTDLSSEEYNNEHYYNHPY
jgi:hypothetical protein